MGDFVMTASVRALPKDNRFFTKVTIEEVDANGDAQVIGTPQLVSTAGQVGQIAVRGSANGMSNSNDDIRVQVQAPFSGKKVNVKVVIERNGQVIADPVIDVPMPR